MPSFRFPKSARLSRAGDFARLRREGTSFHGKLIVLSVLKAEPDTEPRIGIITSRRVGGAVDRNRVRRRLREVIRALRPQIAPGWHIVMVARAAAVGADFSWLRSEIHALARRSPILLPV